MPVIKNCKVCGKQFRTKPFFIKNGGGKYCSAKCHHQGLKNGKQVNCFLCNKEIYRSTKQLLASKSSKFFCSKSCQTKWRNSEFIGAKHSNWKNGEYAYRSILSRNKTPKQCGLCKTKDARVLAVHHIDGNNRNNKLSNLAWVCHNCHHLVHHYGEEKKKFMEALV